MNGFLTRLVQRGAGLPTPFAAPARRTPVAASTSDGVPSSLSPRESAGRDSDDVPPLEVSAQAMERPADSPRSIVPTIPHTQERPHATPESRLGDLSRSDAPPVRMTSHPIQASAVTSPPDGPTLPLVGRVELQSRTSERVGPDLDSNRHDAIGARVEPTMLRRQQLAAPEIAPSSPGDSRTVPASTTAESGRHWLPASPVSVKEVTSEASVTESTAPEAIRKDSSLEVRTPVAEPASIVRLPQSPVPHGEGTEGEQVEVHIGRIEVKVAPPPLTRPSSPRRSTGFDRYRSVRRYADRNWY